MNDLVATLGMNNPSTSQGSQMVTALDEMVADFRTRPFDQGPSYYISCDALTMKVSEGGRVATARCYNQPAASNRCQR